MANKKKKKTAPPVQGSSKVPPRPKNSAAEAKKKVATTSPAAKASSSAASTDATDQKKGYTPPKGRATESRTAGSTQSANRSWFLLGGVAVLIVGALLFFSFRESLDPGGTGVTDSAAWDLPALSDDGDLDGDGRVRLADFAGTPTVVNFFASWCTTCDQELPAFRAQAEALEGQVDFVFVNSNESGDWKPMAERNGVDSGFHLAKDIGQGGRNGLYLDLGGVGGSMPITAFYDAEGNLVEVVRQGMTETQIQETVAGLLG